MREPLSPLSPTSCRRTVDMGDTPIVVGGGAITSAQRFQETAAKKRWKKLRSLMRGAKTLESLAKKKGDNPMERTLILKQASSSKKKKHRKKHGDDSSDS